MIVINVILICFFFLSLRKFEICNRLGKGAYGVVFKATEKRSRAVVALKVYNLIMDMFVLLIVPCVYNTHHLLCMLCNAVVGLVSQDNLSIQTLSSPRFCFLPLIFLIDHDCII